MRTRALMVVSLFVLLIQGVLTAQVQEPNAQAEEVIRIVSVKYYPVHDLAAMLNTLSGGEGTHIIVDENSNRLIVQATQGQVEKVLALIQQLDVPDVSAPAAQFLVCRVFMVEVPPKDPTFKPFALVLRAASTPSSVQILDAIKGDDLRIGRLQGSDGTTDEQQPIMIQGRAASNEAIRRIAESIPESTISELKWDEDAFATDVPAAQVGQLSEQLQQHIRKFLGTEVRTVGYWFGNVSFPGEVAASMGPWMFEMKTRPAQSADLNVEVKVTQEPAVSIASPVTVLGNSVQGRLGKPIIIGYSRDSYGTRTMGAMVILLEMDTAAAGDSLTKTP